MNEKTMSPPFIIYDPECPLCVRFKQALEHMDFDFSLSFYPLDHPELLREFPKLDQDKINKEVHLILDDEGKNILKGHEVIEYLAKRNSTVKKFAWLLDTDVGEKASHFFYKSVNKLRESLHNHCSTCRK
jgi:predicted DCC family thiol-disulfide oxidoreductase YuxK